MAEKVLIANIGAGTNNKPLLEIEFPALTKALEEGWKVKQIEPVPFTSQASMGFTTIIFVLEKRSGNTVM